MRRGALTKLQVMFIVVVVVCALVIEVHILRVTMYKAVRPTPSPSPIPTPSSTPAPTPTPIRVALKCVIRVEADGATLHYQNKSFWDKNSFLEIIKSKDKFKLEEINSFNKSLQTYGNVMINPKVEFDEESKSTTLVCDIKGAMYSANSYDFHWLLADLPFDLYAFSQSEKELTYEGEINGVPTTIKLIFSYTIAHCHEHVWSSE